MKYANQTTVTEARSRAEIENLLTKYGADQYLSGWDQERNAAFIWFRMTGRQVRIFVPLPSKTEREITHTETGRLRSEREQRKAWEQACRQAWRVTVLLIKAKLEAIEIGNTTVEQEFLNDLMLPNGQTVGAFLRPQIASAYERGVMPALLPGSEG